MKGSAHSEGIAALTGMQPRTLQPLLNGAARASQFAAQARSGELPSFGIVTPAMLKARADQVLGDLLRTEQAVNGFRPHPSNTTAFIAWRTQFDAFAAQVKKYIGDLSWVDRLAGGVGEQIESYAAALMVWQQQFTSQFGGYLPGWVPPSSTSSFWRTVGIGVAIALTTAGVIWIVKGTASKVLPPKAPPAPAGVPNG